MHDALDDPTVQKIVCMKSAQVAWTDGVLLNYVGRRIDVDPCPMIIMFAKEKSAKKFNLEKFEPMIEVTPRLSAKLPVHAARDKNNLWDHKTFPRGFLKFITSNAPDDVKSTPAPVVAVEEPDDANANVREQGDSITLLEERNKSYSDSRRKVIFGGTPTVDGFSRIQQAYSGSDQRVYLVPCPDCGEEHELAWENVTWSDDAEVAHEVFGRARPDSARYVCPHCGSLWDDAARVRAVRKGRWVATAPFFGVAGFRLNELVSPFPGSRMAELVKKWLTAEKALLAGDDTKMRAFVNNSQGRPYKYKSDLPELDELAERAMPYAAFTVPAGGLLLTLGVDVQHDRIALVLRAWGRGEESWLVVWDEIHGNVLHQDENPLEGGVWGALTEMLMSGYRHETGGVLRIRAMSIDSSDGSTSDAVYKYVRAARRAGLNVMAIKGSTDANAEVFSVPKQSVDSTRNNSKAAKYGLSVGWWSPTIGSFQYMVDDRSFRIDGKPVWHSGNVTPLDASKGGVMSGSVTFAAGQRLFLDEGSAAFPSIAFVNDGVPDTGLYHARDGVFGVTCNGVVTVTFAQEATYFQAPAAGPSPAAGDNSLRFATTEWVTAAIGTASIGQIVMEARTSTRAGYVKCDGSQYKRADYPALWAYAQASGALVSEAEYASGRWGGFSTADGQTYFRVPDLRGEFLRCWSDGRGDVDAGRAIGSFQASQNQAHTHAASSSTVDDHAHNVWSGPNGWHEHGVNQTPHAHITWTGAVQVAGTAPGAGMGPYNGRVTQMWSDEAMANIGIAGNGTHDHAIAMDGAGKHAHTISVQADGGAEARPRNVALLAMIRAY
ncbi:hypothetical protein BLKGLAD_28250 [Burkholderia gladioli pv. gladioli]